MNTFKSAAIEVLRKAEKPLHYSEITRLALEGALIETEGATPEATMNAQITMDIVRKGAGSLFVKTAPATFSLNPDPKPLKASKSLSEVEKEEEAQLKVESAFTGRGGEHLVCSELLFRGFNASIMGVDTGIDIVATRDRQLYGVQVKTSNINRYATYVSSIRKVSFERHNEGNIFYVFVLKGAKKTDFLILPLKEMEQKVKQKAILVINHGSAYRVTIKFREGEVFLGSKLHKVSQFLNNWDLVK